MGSMQRRKGANGEREIAKILREHGYDAERGCQHKGGVNSPDVIGLNGIHIEVKRVEAFRDEVALQQAERDCGGNIPVVFHRRNGEEWKATMRLDDWLKMYGGTIYGNKKCLFNKTTNAESY